MTKNYDSVNIKVDWPVIARLTDDIYPFNGYDHIRYTARAFIEDEQGRYLFLHIVGEDYFGKRDHLESCGGGLEKGEFLDQTIIREIKEETGYDAYDLGLIGSIYDAYNLINRITFSTFFHCRIDSTKKSVSHQTEAEQILIKELLFLKPLEALDWLENRSINPCDKLVHQRDATVFRYYLENYTDLLK